MISIILPAKNEAAALAGVLPRLRAAYPDADIVLVDDGSSDETRAVSLANGARVFSHPYSMGNGAAIKRGARPGDNDQNQPPISDQKIRAIYQHQGKCR